MRYVLFAVAMLLGAVAPHAQNTPTGTQTVRILVQGDTSRLPDFIESLRREFSDRRMAIVLVDPSAPFDYNVVLAQESSLGGAAAAVIVLDSSASFVTSVVRSGRLSGKGAFNATAKELAKKLAILRGISE